MKSINRISKVMQKAASITTVAVMGFAMMSYNDSGENSDAYKEFNDSLEFLYNNPIPPAILEEFGLEQVNP